MSNEIAIARLIDKLAETRRQATAPNGEPASNRDHLLATEREQRLLAEILREVTLAFVSHTRYTAVLDEILRQVQRIVPYTAANIALVEGDSLQIARGRGYGASGSNGEVTIPPQPLADFRLEHEIIQTRTPLVISDTRQEPRWITLKETAWIRSHLAVPICLHNRVLGLLRLDANTPHEFSEDDAGRLQPLANAAAIALENARLYEQAHHELAERRRMEVALQENAKQMEVAYRQALIYAQELKTEIAERRKAEAETAQRAAQLMLINEIGSNIAAVLELDRVLNRAAHLVQELFNYHHVALFLVEEGVLKLKAVAGSYRQFFPKGHTQQLTEGINGWVALHGKKIVANNVKTEPRFISLIEPHSITRAELCLPIKIAGRTLGVLDIQSPQVNAFSQNDVMAMETLTNQIAVAIENARLYQAVRQEMLEHKRVKEAVDQLRRQNELILNAAGEGIFGLDLQGRHTFVNPAAAAMLGYTVKELTGRPSHLTWHHTKPDGSPYPEDECPIYAAYKDGAVHQGDDELFWRKDGAGFPVEYVSTPIWEEGKIVGAVVVFKDITERKNLTEQYRQAQKMEGIGRLASGVAHDFNNLLTVISGHTELLLQHHPRPDHPEHEPLTHIKNAANRAAALTQQLLTFSRRQPVQLQVLDLNQVVTNLQTMLRRIIGEDVELVTRLAPDLGLVKVDPGQIDQVAMNLVVNARDAMPHGGKLIIETSNVELDETFAKKHLDVVPGPYVLLSVTDTGAGMDAATQARIFDPFFTTKPAGKGTGLGLSTVYGIVHQSKGHISVASAPGKGSTFNIYLPRVKAGATAVQPTWTKPRVDVPLSGSQTVLLVEDDDGVRLVTRKFLEKNGYTVLEAGGGEAALSICREHSGPIHLLITDMVMPKTSGTELARQIVSLRPQIKVLYVSGYSDEEIDQYGAPAAEIPLLQKPFTSQVLARKVQEVLNRPQSLFKG